ncbi:hypothetical protein [Ancylobacter pratisalsi]|uniref:Uncharacterized protein n=1 Tax=Ancylobacter pratisalsi TaxID=1745854 RepID=A0A6P1YJD8_9HYPH|nr:hypothetical protein [Ancylobacter pratisalsi]QIB32816.1 hypothetical protein G3A50_03150 [Ancylobacter pratisalsi]
MDDADRTRGDTTGLSLRDAVRTARLEAAERSGVIVELRDASLARLSMLNELLDPIFAEVPDEHADLFDRGLMPGETPRLFVDMVAHIALGRDRRTYRLLQDTRAGRRVLAESSNPHDIADAVTRYIARRLVAREQAMAASSAPEEIAPRPAPHHPVPTAPATSARSGRASAFLFGLILGAMALAGATALGVNISLR